MIYAKHGNIFSSSDLTNYYSNFNWYKPTKKVKDSDLTEEELKLIERIKIFETRDETKKNIILKNMEGVWQDYFIMAAGWSNRFVFYENKNAEFIFSQMRYIPLAQEMHGTYEVKGNVLILKIKEIIYNSYIPEYDKINMYELDYIPDHILRHEPEPYKGVEQIRRSAGNKNHQRIPPEIADASMQLLQQLCH